MILWALDLPELFEEGDEGCLRSRVSREERQRVDRFVRLEDRMARLSAALLLQQILEDEYGVARGTCGLARSVMGKPVLPGHLGLHVSISHCSGMVLVGVADGPLGVDVERVEGRPLADVLVYLSGSERRIIDTCGDERAKSWAFVRIWTRRESYLKALGIGLSQGLDFFETDGETIRDDHRPENRWGLKSWTVKNSHCASACSVGFPENITPRLVSWNSFMDA